MCVCVVVGVGGGKEGEDEVGGSESTLRAHSAVERKSDSGNERVCVVLLCMKTTAIARIFECASGGVCLI